jgi:hypothetical protein
VTIEAATPYATVNDPARPDAVRALADYRKMFDDFRSTNEENRRQQMLDDDYFHGKQLTVGEKQVLSARGQPDIVINRVRTAVNGILGVIIHSKADPRAMPRTPNDDNSADVCTDTLRYISLKNRFGRTKAASFRDMLINGVGACLIGIKASKDVDLCKIRPEEFFWDPRSREEDFSDARYLGVAKWMYSADVKQMYPTFSEAMSFSSAEGIGGLVDESFEDRPRNQGAWLDIRNRRVMIVEVYHIYDGKWYKCCFYGGGVLEESISPYQDEYGDPTCPIEGMTAYIDRDNNRYGIVRDMRDIQDEINKRRSKLLHLVSSHQIQARDPSAVEVDADAARKEAGRPDGVIPYGWEIVRTTDMSAGQMQLLAEAKNEMERMGPNPAVLGRQGADTSGRALLARQQAGLIELAWVIDMLDDWELRVYKQCWYRAQQYWKDPQWIRVTDDEDAPKFVQLNRPKGPSIPGDNGGPPIDDQERAQQLGIGASPTGSGEYMGAQEDQQPQEGPPQYHPDQIPHPETGELVANPMAGHSVFGYDNEIGEMDVDIILDTQPETANIMQEMIQDLIKLVSASPTYAAQVPFEVFVELSPLPHKRQVLDRIKKYKAEQSQQQAQQMQTQMAASMAKLDAEIDKMRAQSAALLATARAALAKAGADTRELELAEDEADRTAAIALHNMAADHTVEQQRQQELDQNQQQLDQQPAEPAPSGQDG